MNTSYRWVVLLACLIPAASIAKAPKAPSASTNSGVVIPSSATKSFVISNPAGIRLVTINRVGRVAGKKSNN